MENIDKLKVEFLEEFLKIQEGYIASEYSAGMAYNKFHQLKEKFNTLDSKFLNRRLNLTTGGDNSHNDCDMPLDVKLSLIKKAKEEHPEETKDLDDDEIFDEFCYDDSYDFRTWYPSLC